MLTLVRLSRATVDWYDDPGETQAGGKGIVADCVAETEEQLVEV